MSEGVFSGVSGRLWGPVEHSRDASGAGEGGTGERYSRRSVTVTVTVTVTVKNMIVLHSIR